jgi:hypothetical protein
MRSSLVMTLIGAASMAAALLVGCGDNDAKPVSSKAGQSCVRTADCADGLSCIANVCYSNGAATAGSGGSGGSPVVGPVLGGDGESCTSRKDCEDGLACFNQRCTMSTPTGAGGETGATPTPQLGARGETCRVNADCSKELVCVPSNITGVGVCDITNFGITPTGKFCGGECAAASDCCQLPTNEGFRDCPDLAAAIKLQGFDCSAVQVANSISARYCFLDATFCTGCSATTWKCTDNACVYNLACTPNAITPPTDTAKGCPQYTRLNHAVPSCNPKTLKCTPAATGACTTDASCAGLTIIDSSQADTCSNGECTCYAGNKQCYRKCARDLDCPTGRLCDKGSSLCVPDTICTTDAQCAERNGSLDFTCNQDTNTCVHSCKTDRDCSGTGHIVGGSEIDDSFRSVCAANVCTSVATDCVDDSQCGTPEGFKTFCIDRPAVMADTSVTSAVTN